MKEENSIAFDLVGRPGVGEILSGQFVHGPKQHNFANVKEKPNSYKVDYSIQEIHVAPRAIQHERWHASQLQI